MEHLKYIIDDKTIARLLGENNFVNKESAILELVKNSFDAKATKLEIIFSDTSITIIDNGIGMNAGDIRNHWMYIGKSTKGYSILDSNGNQRVLAGSKGVGRFALSRLGEEIELSSQKNNKKELGVLWKTDWNESTLEEVRQLDTNGTTINVKKLRDKWNNTDICGLEDYLSKLYNDNSMKIIITYDDKSVEVDKYFSKPILGVNCLSKINLTYNSKCMNLQCSVVSDEFKEDAQKYCKPEIDIKLYEENIDVFDELNLRYDYLEKPFLKECLKEVGDFSAEFYFSLKGINTDDFDKFLYKYKELPEKYSSGIILYRNSFGISTYEGVKDWLLLGKRSRLSPAAATHKTGSWRVRENQLAGKVMIDKKENEKLIDLSNRQGIEENIYYEMFIDILERGIAEFERYRQAIVRSINIKNEEPKENKKQIIDEIIDNKKSIKDLSIEDEEKLISEIKETKQESKDYKKAAEETKEQSKYDIRILNILATSGLKAMAIAHEMQNDRNNIITNYDNIVGALKEYKLWSVLNEEEKTKYAYKNVPELLNSNKKINSKMVSFMRTLLKGSEKEQFVSKEYNVMELFSRIKEVWKKDYGWINISLKTEGLTKYTIAEDMLKVILDNLILNSIQQNDDKGNLDIKILVKTTSDLLEILYSDNGKGLHTKYKNNPNRILEVHESTRKNGHGLGMWIVNNTVLMSGGKILEIDGNNGFKINFILGGINGK